jgi:hypothetical protein
MQLEEEAAGVAKRLTLGVPAPQWCCLSKAVRTCRRCAGVRVVVVIAVVVVVVVGLLGSCPLQIGG